MRPDVSLIMPAWRPRPEWLRQAVGSALDERGCELELLVVDDGSPEPVETMLVELDDPRLRILRIEHAGPYGARDAGIAEAQGAFLRFVDADDLVEPGSTGRLLDLAREGGEASTYGATLMCDEQLAPQRLFTSELEGNVERACVLGGFEVFVVSLLFPRAVVDRAGRWDVAAFRVSGDWDFVLRALEQAPVRRLDEVVTRYRRHGASVTKTADVAAGARAAQTVLARYFERHPEERGGALERRAYVRLHMDRALAHAWMREPRPFAHHFAQAARRDPVGALWGLGRWLGERARGFSARAPRRALRALRRQA